MIALTFAPALREKDKRADTSMKCHSRIPLQLTTMSCLILVLAFLALANGDNLSLPFTPEVFILGGSNATIEDFPYHVALELYNGYRCGASLIRPNVALTAAHCASGESATDFTIRAGTSIRESGGETVGVREICQHPKYQSSSNDYDVSVLLLSESFALSSTIQTIPPQSTTEDVPVGTLGNVTGWGTTSFGGPMSKFLQVVQLSRVSQESCIETYSKVGETVTINMSCYGYAQGGKGSCQKDSGGPMVVNGKVAGIVSWGRACGLADYPDVYTNVAAKEINDHINQCLANA